MKEKWLNRIPNICQLYTCSVTLFCQHDRALKMTYFAVPQRSWKHCEGDWCEKYWCLSKDSFLYDNTKCRRKIKRDARCFIHRIIWHRGKYTFITNLNIILDPWILGFAGQEFVVNIYIYTQYLLMKQVVVTIEEILTIAIVLR